MGRSLKEEIQSVAIVSSFGQSYHPSLWSYERVVPFHLGIHQASLVGHLVQPAGSF
jgi:hypothetical protein